MELGRPLNSGMTLVPKSTDRKKKGGDGINLKLLKYVVTWYSKTLNDGMAILEYYDRHHIDLPHRYTDSEINAVCKLMNNEIISGKSYLWSKEGTIYVVR